MQIRIQIQGLKNLQMRIRIQGVKSLRIQIQVFNFTLNFFLRQKSKKRSFTSDQNADPDLDPDPGTQENADPDPGTPKMRIQCGSGSETLTYFFFIITS